MLEVKFIQEKFRDKRKGGFRMSKYMPILKALKRGYIKQEDFVDYTPNAEEYMYAHDMMMGQKKIRVERDLGWHPVIYKDFAVFLVASKTTEAYIHAIDGIIMYQDLENFAAMYENSYLRTNSVVLTPELSKLIPEKFRQKDVGMYREYRRNGFMRYQRRRQRDPACPHDHRYHAGPIYHSYHMQPIVFIPPDTMVEIEEGKGAKKESGFKLYPKNAEELGELPKESFQLEETPKWIPLSEAMMTRVIKETDYVAYVPDKATVSFTAKETNTESAYFGGKAQTAETEYTLEGWHPILCYREARPYVQLVARRSTKFKLTIWPKEESGKSGYCTEVEGDNQAKVGIELLERYAKIYSNQSLKATGIPFTEEIMDILPNELIFREDSYWLANIFEYKLHWAGRRPLKLSEYYGLKKGLVWVGDDIISYKRIKDTVLDSQNMRIAIAFENDVLVKINDKSHNGASEKNGLMLKSINVSRKQN